MQVHSGEMFTRRELAARFHRSPKCIGDMSAPREPPVYPPAYPLVPLLRVGVDHPEGPRYLSRPPKS